MSKNVYSSCKTHHVYQSQAAQQCSTALMATPQVNGKGGILTPYRIKTNQLSKNLAQLIRSTRGPHLSNLVTIHSVETSGQMGKIQRLVTFYPRRARSALGVDIVLTLDVCMFVC